MHRTPDILTFVDSLQKSHRQNLGFLPKQALQEYIARKQFNIATINNETAGYFLWRNPSRPSPAHPNPSTTRSIIQACVMPDARRQRAATKTLRILAGNALRDGRTNLQLWSGENNEANEFWLASGFRVIARRLGTNRIHKIHLLWTMDLTQTRPEQVGTPAPPRNAIFIPPWLPPCKSRQQHLAQLPDP